MNENAKMYINFDCTLWTILKKESVFWILQDLYCVLFLWDYLSIPIGGFQKPHVLSVSCVRPQVMACKLSHQTRYSRHWCSQYDLSLVCFFMDVNELLDISF
jgi:hypothetical protein